MDSRWPLFSQSLILLMCLSYGVGGTTISWENLGRERQMPRDHLSEQQMLLGSVLCNVWQVLVWWCLYKDKPDRFTPWPQCFGTVLALLISRPPQSPCRPPYGARVMSGTWTYFFFFPTYNPQTADGALIYYCCRATADFYCGLPQITSSRLCP